MKTTLEIPDELFRTAKAKAAMRGIPFRQIVTEALAEKFDPKSGNSDTSGNPPWMQGFGGLSELHDETVRINSVIREEFETLEAEDIL
ncbi:MAG: hypothetical protein NWT08_09505 [Akkermansiaceae bacterium]|nr:hypothetical protein [Akkermansiaceae bacterium]MDP4647026.1 hypothetical protein [Akkermansiaceae bacterium]MDP4721275.1 hypothetical protein [Akkermansiaceae bacterium]MDP4778965.1 hypothetical protein [Akkermansiaceae bacterium]MDP4847167.1 hypothetical protein [Akkermansiaceae bacterium]